MQAATEYFERTGIFPIMHILGVRRELAENMASFRRRS
jgi:hypothetical protein